MGQCQMVWHFLPFIKKFTVLSCGKQYGKQYGDTKGSLDNRYDSSAVDYKFMQPIPLQFLC